MKKTGGSAFPRIYKEDMSGMSLRDWFAGMAMQGLMSYDYDHDNEDVAKWAYEIADAMIAEREKE